MRDTAPCPKCKTLNRVELKSNMLGETIEVIKCGKCGSTSVCQDRLRWALVVENNISKKQ